MRAERWEAAATLAVLLALAFDAGAQATYKLVDRTGKVTYSDKVPKNFDGQVTRIDIDPSTNVQPPGQPPGQAPAQPPVAATKAEVGKADPDMNSRRRAVRERLQANIDSAHERVDKAKEALASGVHPKEGEYRWIQQKYDGSAKAGPRPNCVKKQDIDGKTIWSCPTMVPGDIYRDRMAALETELRDAEAELTRAQDEYRRNVD